jgi:hypothetical protein
VNKASAQSGGVSFLLSEGFDLWQNLKLATRCGNHADNTADAQVVATELENTLAVSSRERGPAGNGREAGGRGLGYRVTAVSETDPPPLRQLPIDHDPVRPA